MAKKTPSGDYARSLKEYEALVATRPGVTRKGATMPYTSLNGHMFSLLTQQGVLILRLPERERDAFRKKYGTPPVVLYGALMKEYIEVLPSLLKKTRELRKHFDISHEYVGSLKPKPTARKKR